MNRFCIKRQVDIVRTLGDTHEAIVWCHNRRSKILQSMKTMDGLEECSNRMYSTMLAIWEYYESNDINTDKHLGLMCEEWVELDSDSSREERVKEALVLMYSVHLKDLNETLRREETLKSFSLSDKGQEAVALLVDLSQYGLDEFQSVGKLYSLPLEQTTLKLYEVDVQTEDGDECTYYIWMDPNEGDPPGQRAVNWLNEDEKENGSGKVSDGTWNVSEYPPTKPDVEWDINDSLERVYGEFVAVSNGRIFFDNLDYNFLPEDTDGLDLQDHSDGDQEMNPTEELLNNLPEYLQDIYQRLMIEPDDVGLDPSGIAVYIKELNMDPDTLFSFIKDKVEENKSK